MIAGRNSGATTARLPTADGKLARTLASPPDGREERAVRREHPDLGGHLVEDVEPPLHVGGDIDHVAEKALGPVRVGKEQPSRIQPRGLTASRSVSSVAPWAGSSALAFHSSWDPAGTGIGLWGTRAGRGATPNLSAPTRSPT